MKDGGRMKIGMVWIMFAFYMYALFKIIVLKFSPADAAFLWERLQYQAARPEYIAARLQAGNLVPFKEITRAIDTLTVHSLWNLLGNIAIFIPLGLFLGILAKPGKLTLAGAVWRSLAVSFGLESAQLLFAVGTFDVDDLILNSAGGAIGFIVYALNARLTAAASAYPRGKPVR